MRDRILQELKKLEEAHDIKVLLAVESGSRGWGFPSADSDYDARFIYLHKPDWYISVNEKRDVIDLPCDGVLDINGWDLRKTLRLFLQSNLPLLEWLQSPVKYAENGPFASALRALIPQFFSPVHGMHHYFHTAKNKMAGDDESSIRLKRYFYMLRPLLACLWIEKYGSCPPMDFESLLAGSRLDDRLLAEIAALVSRKAAATEDAAEAPNPVLMGFISSSTMARLEPILATVAKTPHGDVEDLNRLFRQTLRDDWHEGA